MSNLPGILTVVLSLSAAHVCWPNVVYFSYKDFVYENVSIKSETAQQHQRFIKEKPMITEHFSHHAKLLMNNVMTSLKLRFKFDTVVHAIYIASFTF